MGMWGGVTNRMLMRLERSERPCEHADRQALKICCPIRANLWGEVRYVFPADQDVAHCNLRGRRSVVGEYAAACLPHLQPESAGQSVVSSTSRQSVIVHLVSDVQKRFRTTMRSPHPAHPRCIPGGAERPTF